MDDVVVLAKEQKAGRVMLGHEWLLGRIKV